MALDLDLDAFFDTDAFAELATYMAEGALATQIPVIFDGEYTVAMGPAPEGVGTSAPRAQCKTTDAPNAGPKDRLEVRGVGYYVTEAQPDGNGMTVLILSRDPI